MEIKIPIDPNKLLPPSVSGQLVVGSRTLDYNWETQIGTVWLRIPDTANPQSGAEVIITTGALTLRPYVTEDGATVYSSEPTVVPSDSTTVIPSNKIRLLVEGILTDINNKFIAAPVKSDVDAVTYTEGII